VVPEGVQLAAGTEAPAVVANIVTEGHFSTVGVPIVQGREFAANR
jgi:hypothetical protein